MKLLTMLLAAAMVLGMTVAAAAAAAENAAVATAPQTFDAGVIAAVSAIVFAAGYILTKKRVIHISP